MGVSLDLHMHSTVSDGTDTPSELVHAVRKLGITVFSLTDHDAVKGCAEVRRALKDITYEEGETPLRFIPGVEFSCKDPFGKYHILGYGYDDATEPVRAVVAKGHSLRMEKLNGRLGFLKDAFGFAFSDTDRESLYALDNPGKPHIGNLMVKYGYAKDKETAIKEYINKKKFPDIYVLPEEAIRGILGSGGIPVLAHPIYGSGDQVILGDDLKERIRRLMGFGLQGIEAFYSGFTPKMITELTDIAEENDLYITAGSDYHGSNKLVPLGDTNLPADEELPKNLKRFLEAV